VDSVFTLDEARAGELGGAAVGPDVEPGGGAGARACSVHDGRVGILRPFEDV
jgi:hypothetical protein